MSSWREKSLVVMSKVAALSSRWASDEAVHQLVGHVSHRPIYSYLLCFVSLVPQEKGYRSGSG